MTTSTDPSRSTTSPSRSSRAALVVVVALIGILLGSPSSLAGRVRVEDIGERIFASVAVTDEGRELPLVPGTRLILRFERWREGPAIHARAGCNSMGGLVKTGRGRLRLVEHLLTTSMECRPDLARQEQWFARLLHDKPTIDLYGQRLVLSAQSRRVEFVG